MVSEMAESDIEEMQEAGLRPTARDIVRLNALGLKCACSEDAATLYELPRVAYLGDLALREPALGHFAWIDAALRHCDQGDFTTVLIVEAFALSRGLAELPNADDRRAVSAAINAFAKGPLSRFTPAQIRCAVWYARFGADATAAEFPAPPPRQKPLEDDAALSVGAGVLYETLSVGLGLSVRDAAGLTLSKARALNAAALARLGVETQKRMRPLRLGEYYTTRDEIRARLEAERAAEGKADGAPVAAEEGGSANG